jgi:hypothetical protein
MPSRPGHSSSGALDDLRAMSLTSPRLQAVGDAEAPPPPLPSGPDIDRNQYE